MTWSKFQDKAFLKTDLFTLPAQERLAYFPAQSYKGKIQVIPNYPAKYLFLSLIFLIDL